MIVFSEHISEPLRSGEPPVARLVLPFAQRQRARQRAVLDDGTTIGIVLPRGTVLRGGDRLRAPSGEVVEVVAAPEAVSTAAADPWLLARGAYHLGNRHVPLEVGAGWVRYLQDHVLDAMLERLGLSVLHEYAPFEPEAGAYTHSHGNGHAHGH